MQPVFGETADTDSAVCFLLVNAGCLIFILCLILQEAAFPEPP